MYMYAANAVLPVSAAAWHHHYPNVSSIHPKSIANHAWAKSIEQSSSSFDEEANYCDNEDGSMNIQSRARAETLRWVDNFVVPLKLCPWAAASMDAYHNDDDDDVNNDNNHALRSSVQIRMVDIPSDSSAKEAQDILAEAVRIEAEGMSAMEDYASDYNFVTPLSDHDEDKRRTAASLYNPNVAITFVVPVPEETNPNRNGDDDWTFHDFHTFHDSVVYIEEEYLPSIPIISAISQEEEGDERLTLADRVAIAGFHPQWEYVSSSNSNADDNTAAADINMGVSMEEVAQLNAISYEKRSPFPTVTIVHWSAIDNDSSTAMSNDDEDLGSNTMAQHITERIAEHNSEVLSKLGVDALEEIYVRDVLLDP
eukprot:CAMPEP_0196823630 /NCGR_PEP_ID=MMETSP1362-20130617/88277_1 /TAXON_ID=163516 /ORGANISM="Leptocylindrus danicus, Strain CCMP1856" /LENGTH=367 /DNA_ID=CAMNT_0042203577 /DNA_START=150 /DNA_END=1253 /DNA_ORIENTATION=+